MVDSQRERVTEKPVTSAMVRARPRSSGCVHTESLNSTVTFRATYPVRIATSRTTSTSLQISRTRVYVKHRTERYAVVRFENEAKVCPRRTQRATSRLDNATADCMKVTRG